MNLKFRIIKDKLFKLFIIFFSFLAILPLVFILFYVFKNGLPYVNWEFLISLPKPVGEEGGGISNAIVGTLILIIFSSLLSLPLGIITGVYLSEHREGKLPYLVRLCIEVLQGIPSIVIGIIAYVWVVVPMGGFSAIAGAVALAIIMLPVIVRATEETLALIPESLKEAALALGVPYYRTIIKVILPAGLSGILTGILVSIARIAGETAPLLFTAFGSPFMNVDVSKPVNSLPLLIFKYAMSPYAEWQQAAWAASVVLITLVLSLNLLVKIVTKKWKVQF